MGNSRSRIRQNRVFIFGLMLVVAISVAPLGVAQVQQIDLDGNPLNGNESTIDTKVIENEGAPVQFENIIVNNALATGFTFSWPGAGPGGFDAILKAGPDVGTKWVWTTTGQVYTISSPATFERDTRQLPVFGQPAGGVLGATDDRVFDVVGKSLIPVDVTLSSTSLTSSLVTFFSPENTLATCGSVSNPGQFDQIVHNFSGVPVTMEFTEDPCCGAPQMTICDDGCQFYLTDNNNCGGCGNVCESFESCEEGICVEGCAECEGGGGAAAVVQPTPPAPVGSPRTAAVSAAPRRKQDHVRINSVRPAPIEPDPYSARGATRSHNPTQWTEVDAGDLPGSSEEPIGAGALTQIVGSIGQGADVDVYKICLSGGGDFSATVPRDPIDAQLFLFDSNGLGVYSSDDEVIFVGPPVLPAENVLTPLEPGVYYLAVNRWEVLPSSAGGDIFGTAVELNGPTGPGGSQPLTGWGGSDFYAGVGAESYSINLTGAVYCLEAAVCAAPPELEEPITIPDGGSVTICQTGSVVGREIRTTTKVVTEDGEVVGEGPCGLIVPDLTFVPQPFVPSPVDVEVVGGGLLRPGKTSELVIAVLNLGTAGLASPTAVLSTEPDALNPTTFTFSRDTSTYESFPELPATTGCPDPNDPPPPPPVFEPKKNLMNFIVHVDPGQAPDVGRVFNVNFQDAAGSISIDMPLVIGIGRCDSTNPEGTYDTLDGLLYPVEAELVSTDLPPNVAPIAFSHGMVLPLRLRLECDGKTLGPGDMDVAPEIVSIVDESGGNVPLVNINASPNPDDPFFVCGPSLCQFSLRTDAIPAGPKVITFRMPDSREVHAAVTTD